MSVLEKTINRLLSGIEIIPESGCWIWMKSMNKNGYCQVRRTSSRILTGVHRLSYEVFVGPIPDGLDIDHRCKVRCCINPHHLDPVTRLENLNRAGIIDQALKRIKESSEKTHCKHGHPLTGDNLYVYPNGKHRACRTCLRISGREFARKKRVNKKTEINQHNGAIE